MQSSTQTAEIARRRLCPNIPATLVTNLTNHLEGIDLQFNNGKGLTTGRLRMIPINKLTSATRVNVDCYLELMVD